MNGNLSQHIFFFTERTEKRARVESSSPYYLVSMCIYSLCEICAKINIIQGTNQFRKKKLYKQLLVEMILATNLTYQIHTQFT